MFIVIAGDGREYGPLSAQQVRDWLSQGSINEATKIKRQGEENWKTIADFPEITSGDSSSKTSLEENTSMFFSESKLNTETSKLAIASMILGLASLLCLGFLCIPAVICGHMALARIKKEPNLEGRRFAITGLVSGYLILLTFVVIFTLILMGNQVLKKYENILDTPALKSSYHENYGTQKKWLV